MGEIFFFFDLNINKKIIIRKRTPNIKSETLLKKYFSNQLLTQLKY